MRIGKTDFGQQPVFLAPMEDITDPAFRLLCKSFGADLVTTEFISSEGLIRDACKSTEKLLISEAERPVAIQLFGHHPQSMADAAKRAADAGPDIIDLNFGCPVKKVVTKGAGAALLKNLPLMQEIAEAVVKACSIPVTAKTRLGWDEMSNNVEEAVLRLQDAGIAAVCVHGRTRSQLYGGKADWTKIGELKSNPQIHIPIIGNGDIKDGISAKDAFEQYGIDAIMIGRAAIGNPSVFREIGQFLRGEQEFVSTAAERISICSKHVSMALQLKGERRAIPELRKHYAAYLRGIPGNKNIRLQLYEATEENKIQQILAELLVSLQQG